MATAKKKTGARQTIARESRAKVSAGPKKQASAKGVHGPARDQAQRDAFHTVVAGHSPEVRALATKARALVIEAMPGVLETVWLDQGVTSYGTGPRKMSDHFTFFLFSKSHLAFGFYFGAELPDPEGLLEGTGKSMRHVKVRSEEDLARPALRALLKKATVHRVPPLAR